MRESAPELAKFDVSSWFGVFLPKGVPAPVLDALNKEIKVLLARDDIRTPSPRSAHAPTTARRSNIPFVQAETAKFGAIIKRKACRWTRAEGALVLPVRMIC